MCQEILGCSVPLYDSIGLVSPEKILISGFIVFTIFGCMYMKANFFNKMVSISGLLLFDVAFSILCMFCLLSPLFRITWHL